MTNSDKKYGTYNKQTKIYTQPEDGSSVLRVYESVDDAKAFIFTNEALAVFDECCTNLQWAVIADGNGDNTWLKVTFDFGIKDNASLSPSDHWAEQFKTRKQALIDSDGFFHNVVTGPSPFKGNRTGFVVNDSSDHLF
tara:strand:- start:6 stop:419 length:414 start_codon:yes stop_codon:yes gene_type:complete